MNQKLWKRLAAAVFALSLLGTLSACGGGLSEKDAEAYVKGHLEDMTEAEAKDMYQNNVTWEAEILLQDFLDVDYPTDEMVERSEKLIETIYSKAKYQVGSGTKTKDGDFVVEVTVSPIEVLYLLTDEDVFDALDQSGYGEAETEEQMAEADAVYGMLMLDKLEELLPQMSYGKDQIIMLQLKPDDEGYYVLVETGIQKVDEVMIDYSGTYAE